MQPYEHRVQYYETDGMGIVHHSNYIRWFEEARIDFMTQIGYPYDRLEREGVSSPVMAVNCLYKSPARFGETVCVSVSVLSLSAAKLAIGYGIRDKETHTLRAAGETRHCFAGRDGRPLALKRANPALYALLAQRVCGEAGRE